MPQPPLRRRTPGFTLIEMMVTLAVLVVLLTLVVPSMAAMLQRQRVQGSAEQAALDVHQARAEALARQQSVFLSTSAASGGGSCYVMSIGNSDGCSCAVSGPPVCDAASTALKNVAFAAGHAVQLQSAPRSMAIDALRGGATPVGELVFGDSGGSGPTMKVVVSSRRLRLCTVGDPGCP